MGKQNLDELYGKGGQSDYSVGDTITFEELRETRTGTVLHVTPPSKTAGGRPYPLSYAVDCNDGFPHIVYQNQIIVDPGTKSE